MKPDPIIVEAIDAALVRVVSRETERADAATARAERAEAAIQRVRQVERKLWEQVAQLKALYSPDGSDPFDAGRLVALQDSADRARR